MNIYKAPDNSLHCIEPECADMLPAGCVEITEAEADEIRAANQPQPDPVQLVKDQIVAIERDTMMNRAVREGWLLLVEREAMREFGVDQPTAQSGLYSGNLAYKKVKDVDTQIVALRSQIGEL